MSSLTKSLEKRIQELTTSIEAQQTELAAYEKVLAVETGKTETLHEEPSVLPSSHMAHPVAKKMEAVPAELPTHAAAGPDLSGLEFTGNKTNLVAAIVEKFGSKGATPKDVDSVFTERKVARSKNLIYNTLSYLVAQKKLVRKDGRYVVVKGAISPKKVGRPEKSAKPVKAAAPVKRKISAEGIKRIREANKKRWAAKKAADMAAAKTAPTKTAPAKTPGRKKKAA